MPELHSVRLRDLTAHAYVTAALGAVDAWLATHPASTDAAATEFASGDALRPAPRVATSDRSASSSYSSEEQEETAEEIVIVTASSASFFDRLQNLVGSVHVHEPRARIVIYDLGLNAAQRAEVEVRRVLLACALWQGLCR